MIKRFIQSIENLSLTSRDRLVILLCIILLRNLLESQFEFPGFIGFVKIPVDSFLAFFVHFPLFYLALFSTLFLALSWLRGDRDRVANVLVIGFVVILIPPLFDHIFTGKPYHLAYFFESESYARGLIGVAMPWIRGIGNVSPGQRIEVYLTDVLVFVYLLACDKALWRALVGFVLTHVVIAGFGGIGILLKIFMDKNWLCFSHHQIFIQVFAGYLLLIEIMKRRGKLDNQPGLRPSFFALTGIIYCLKIKLPLGLHPFVFSSIVSVIIAGYAISLASTGKKLGPAFIGLALAASVRYETLIFAAIIILLQYINAISRNRVVYSGLSVLVALASLFMGTSLFFFYHAISLTPFLLIVLIVICSILLTLVSKWWQVFAICAITLVVTFIMPSKRALTEHASLLNSIEKFRNKDYKNAILSLENVAENDITNFFKGASLVNLGYADAGLSCLNKVTIDDRDLVYAKLGAYNQSNRALDGLKIIERGISAGLMVDELYLESARQAILLGNFSKAVESINNAYLFGVGEDEYCVLLADVRYYQRRYAEAIRLCKQAQKSNSDNYYAYAQEGMAQYAMLQYERAIGLFRKAIKLNSSDAIVHNNYGVVLRSTGSFEQARNEFMLALKLAPTFVDAYYNLGVLSSLENKKNEAFYWFDKTLAINPQFEPARHALENK